MELITSTLEDIEIEHTKEIEEAYREGQFAELSLLPKEYKKHRDARYAELFNVKDKT